MQRAHCDVGAVDVHGEHDSVDKRQHSRDIRRHITGRIRGLQRQERAGALQGAHRDVGAIDVHG